MNFNFLRSCGSLFAGSSRLQDAEDSDGDDDPWRAIQTHKGEIVRMRPEDAEAIDPLKYRPFPLVHYVFADPQMAVISGFLQEDTISHIIQLCPGRWKHSRVGVVNGDFRKGSESDVRTSSSCTLRRGETAIIRELERRVSELAGIDVRYLENLAPVRYLPGEQYRPHHDGSARPVTVFLYLNDVVDDAGGETYFPVLDVKFVPRKGCAIMWRNPLDANGGDSRDNEDTRMLHSALPISKGVKYGLNCFFNMQPQDKDEDLEWPAPAPPPSHAAAMRLPMGQAVSWVPPPQAVLPPPRGGFPGPGFQYTGAHLINRGVPGILACS